MRSGGFLGVRGFNVLDGGGGVLLLHSEKFQISLSWSNSPFLAAFFSSTKKRHEG